MDGATKSFEVSVIAYPAGSVDLMFLCDGARFKRLPATPFIDGSLVVLRGGTEFDRTKRIAEYGTHGASTCFCGLDKVFACQVFAHGVMSLAPANFREGDLLVIEAAAAEVDEFRDQLTGYRRAQQAQRDSGN